MGELHGISILVVMGPKWAEIISWRHVLLPRVIPWVTLDAKRKSMVLQNTDDTQHHHKAWGNLTCIGNTLPKNTKLESGSVCYRYMFHSLFLFLLFLYLPFLTGLIWDRYQCSPSPTRIAYWQALEKAQVTESEPSSKPDDTYAC